MEQTPLENQELSAEQLSELLQVRRDKLNNLIEQGKNPLKSLPLTRPITAGILWPPMTNWKAGKSALPGA